MKNNILRYILIVMVCLLATLSAASFSTRSVPLNKVMVADTCITSYLDNIAGDTYAPKFKNSCSDDYRVYYQIIDGDKTIQDTTSIVVKANSSNTKGTLHCSSKATIKIIKKEIIK